mgnify:CR=1 FL=1
MKDTTNSQAKKSNAGTSIPSKDLHVLPDGTTKLKWDAVPPEIQQAIQYLEYRKLRHKHPHVWEF